MSSRTVPASAGQRLLWFMEHYRGRAGVLNCPLLLRMRGRLDLALLQAVLDTLAARHEALRTTFTGRGRHLAQVIHDPQSAPIAVVDLANERDAGAEVQRKIAAELQTQIDPQIWPVRLTVWRRAPDDHVLCINVHHLVSDGWSCGVIFQELLQLYDRLSGGRSELPPPGWQYSQFVEWQAARFDTDTFQAHRAYWRRELDGATFPALPAQAAGHATDGIRRDSAPVTREVAAALRDLARRRRTTIFTVLLSIYYVLLHRLTGETDLSVASVFANRLAPELQRTVGALAHMLVLRTRLRRAATFLDVCREAHATVAGALLHQDVPYHMIGGVGLNPGPARAGDLVFQMVAKALPGATAGGVRIDAMEVDGMGQRFGFECAVFPIDDAFTIAVAYNQARIDPRFAREFVAQYAAAASEMAANPDTRLAAVAA